MRKISDRSQLTQALLKTILSYDPQTGEFKWLVSLSNRVKVGSVAGSKRSDGHVEIRFSGLLFLAHRLAWLYENGTYPNRLDHKNGNTGDNRLENLRPATSSQNQANKRVSKNNKAGYKGIWQVVNKGKGTKWRAGIVVDNEYFYLGSFDTKQEAAERYNQAAKHYFGEFAKLNEIG